MGSESEVPFSPKLWLEADGVIPALLALTDAAADFIAEMERESWYFVGTPSVVRCNQGMVYSPILFRNGR